MKIRRLAFVLMGMILLAGTASAQQVKTDYDRSTDFAQYKTYSWENVHTQNPLWVDRIKAAVNSAPGRSGCRAKTKLAREGKTTKPSFASSRVIASRPATTFAQLSRKYVSSRTEAVAPA